MKKALLITFGLALVITANSQKLSLLAGPSLSGGTYAYDNESASVRNSLGVIAGVQYSHNLSESLLLETGVFYSGKVIQTKDAIINQWSAGDNVEYENAPTWLSAQYMELPLCVTYLLGEGKLLPLITFGGYYGYAFRASYQRDWEDIPIFTGKGEKQIKRDNLGLLIGVGADLNNHARIALVYNHGLVNLSNLNNQEIFYRSVNVTFSVKIFPAPPKKEDPMRRYLHLNDEF